MAYSTDLRADAALIRASGLFNEAHYRVQRPDLPATADAALDYLRDGAAFSVGRLFDAPEYLRRYPDVAAAGQPALTHYLKHGRAEGRSNIFGVEANDDNVRLTVPLPPTRPTLPGLVVVVYASSIAALSRAAAKLRTLPGPFTLLVAVPADKAGADRAIATSNLRAAVQCQLVQDDVANANSSPLFSIFAQDVLRHEFVLHLNAREGEDNADALLGAEPVIDTWTQAFLTHPKLGLIYPANSEQPYWRRHWLGNEGVAPAYLRVLGIAHRGHDAYLHYPADGAFAARVDALRSILETPLSMPERHKYSGSPDLKLQVLPLVARARGFSFVEYAPALHELRLDWGETNFETYYGGDWETASKRIDAADIVSFDIFDTLLLRDSISASAVQKFAGLRLSAQHAVSAEDFYVRRFGAEHGARQDALQSDVTLSDIYARFERTSTWTDDVISQARALEEDADARALRMRPGAEKLLAHARARGKKIVGLSDTYYSAAQVKGLLQKADLLQYFHEIYVSSEQQARKDRGDLWDKVLKSENAQGKNWLHVGDSEYADIAAAEARGLQHLHTMRPATLLSCAGLDFSAPVDRWATDLLAGPIVNEIAGDLFDVAPAGAKPRLRDAEQVGFCALGPIVFAFLHWLVNHQAFKSVSGVYFLSREGFLLERVYWQVRERCPGLGLPPGTYLYASRRAALGARLGVTFDPWLIVAGANFRGSVADLLRQRVGFEAGPDDARLTQEITLPDDEAEVLLVLENLRAEICAHGRAECEAYRAYLESVGLTQGHAAIVDVGYSATIQAALQHVVGRAMTGFYIGASPKARQVEDMGGKSFGFLAEDIAPRESKEPAIAYPLLTEALLIASHGQFARMTTSHGALTPEFRAPSHDAEGAAIISDIHDGAARYCSRMLDVYGETIWRAAIDTHAPQEVFRAIVEGSIEIPQAVRMGLQTEDDFSGSGTWLPLEAPQAPWKL